MRECCLETEKKRRSALNSVVATAQTMVDRFWKSPEWMIFLQEVSMVLKKCSFLCPIIVRLQATRAKSAVVPVVTRDSAAFATDSKSGRLNAFAFA